jgi:hypothetical protein
MCICENSNIWLVETEIIPYLKQTILQAKEKIGGISS